VAFTRKKNSAESHVAALKNIYSVTYNIFTFIVIESASEAKPEMNEKEWKHVGVMLSLLLL
jgi:hypothetical protein